MSRKKKSTNKTSLAFDQLSDSAAIKIVQGIRRLQNAFGHFMNSRTKNISTRTWKVLIVLFSVGWGAISLYFIIHAVNTKQQGLHEKSSMQFIVKPPRNDSLTFIEQIYEQQKRSHH